MKRAETFSKRYSSQSAFELEKFIEFLKEKNVTSYLEIGTRHGDTFHAVMSALPPGSKGVAVDLPGGLWGKESSRDYMANVVNDLKSKGYEIHCIFGDSQSDEIRSMVEEHADFDAILIDGDHTLPGVTKDWENYREMSRIVAFHDVVGTGQAEKRTNKPVEVPILWEKIKSVFPYVEFIDENSAMGIGVCLR